MNDNTAEDLAELELALDGADVKPLTDWKKEPTVTDLKQDYTDALSDKTTRVQKIDAWLDNLNITGAAKTPKRKGYSSVDPKLIRKQAEWRYSALSEPFLSTDDLFNTEPVTFEDKEAAFQNGLVLNNQFNTKLDKVNLIDEYVRTAVDEGTIIIRVGWDFQEEEQDVEVPVFELVPIEDPIRANELTSQGIPALEQVQTGTKIEQQMFTTKNQPTVEICNYKNVTIDPTCEGKLADAKFIIYSFQTSKAELGKNPKYKNLDKLLIETTSILNDADHSTKDDSSFNFKDHARKLFIAYEYWGFRDIDGSGKLTPIVATYANGVLLHMEENPFPDKKLPFVTVQYLPVRKSIYGEPDGELLKDNQKIVGAVTRGMLDTLARSANGQVGSRKDALDVTNRRKFEKGLDYQYNQAVNPVDAFHMHTYPEIPQSAITVLSMQNAESESLSGVKAFSDGISGQALGNTATGIRSALDATSKRELGILRRLANGWVEVGCKIVSMNAEFLEEEEVVRVTNQEFVAIRRDDLAGNFDLKLTISTAEADNEKASDLSFMLQTMGNNMPQEYSTIILEEIATLRKMPHLAKKIKDFVPQPDPLAQRKAELEVELLQAQVFNETMKGEENKRDIALKEAKTGTEIAKGRNLDTQSDKQDLDYLEQESGLTRQHEENMKDHDRGTALDLEAAKVIAQPKDNSFTPIPEV